MTTSTDVADKLPDNDGRVRLSPAAKEAIADNPEAHAPLARLLGMQGYIEMWNNRKVLTPPQQQALYKDLTDLGGMRNKREANLTAAGGGYQLTINIGGVTPTQTFSGITVDQEPALPEENDADI